MEGEWPLVGRTAEVERIDTLLGGPHAGGVVLAGPSGVGKTRLAVECLRRAAERQFTPLRVAATQAASTLPFGAFAPLVPDLRGNDRLDVMRQVVTAVLERGAGKRLALLIDDAHLLDEASATLAHHLTASAGTFVVATVRSGEPTSDAVIALWKDGLAARLDVSPLTVDDIDALLRAVLGGPADRSLVQTLWDRTRGNVLFLKELVTSGLETRVIAEDRGLWRLRGALPASSRLIELVENRLAGLAEADRAALEVVAFGEPLEVDLLPGLAPGAALDDLEYRGLVRTQADNRRLVVSLAHPLYGDVLRARVSPLRARMVSRSLAAALEATGGRRRNDVLRLATWHLEGGGDTDPGLMLTAARRARSRWALLLSERLAQAAVQAGGGFEAGLFLGHLAYLQGHSEEAERILAGLEAPTVAQRAALADIRMDNLCHGLGRIDAALRVGHDAEAEITDAAIRDELATKRAMLLLIGGQTSAALELFEWVLARTDGRAFLAASFGGSIALTLAGRHGDALDLLSRGEAAHGAFPGRRPFGLYMFANARSNTLANAGRLFEAEALAASQYAEAVRDGLVDPQAGSACFLSKALLARGQVETAARMAKEAVARYRQELHFLPLLRIALAALAHALALRGAAAQADAVVAELDDLPPSIRWGEGESGRARAWAAVARSEVAVAKKLLEEAARESAARGDHSFEAAALHDLVRLGDAKQVVARLGQLTHIVDGDLVGPRAAHAAAAAEDDAAGLERASVAFERLGADLWAAEAAADAAVAWRKAGGPRKATAAERRARALAGRCEGARTPALNAITARAALSARELEIARLAASGVPNKVIASRLYLSLHTVQNKLHSVYEKLGVQGRAELAEALEDFPPGEK